MRARQARRSAVVVEAKRVLKKEQVVLGSDIAGLGKQGTMTWVPLGYFRNYLRPKGLAYPATTSYLKQLEREQQEKDRAYQKQVLRAKAMATALQTIGKFEVFKKVGENKRIYGSVTTQEVAEAIARQTNQTLPKENFDLPDIKETGTYTASVKLHKEVTGQFKIVVSRAKQQA